MRCLICVGIIIGGVHIGIILLAVRCVADGLECIWVNFFNAIQLVVGGNVIELNLTHAGSVSIVVALSVVIVAIASLCVVVPIVIAFAIVVAIVVIVSAMVESCILDGCMVRVAVLV